jgi:hypothetical protein
MRFLAERCTLICRPTLLPFAQNMRTLLLLSVITRALILPQNFSLLATVEGEPSRVMPAKSEGEEVRRS